MRAIHYTDTGTSVEGDQTPRWQELAACHGMPVDLFYIPDGIRGKAARRWEERAKAICDGCSVRAKCEQQATTQPERFGVWAGMSPTERGWPRQ